MIEPTRNASHATPGRRARYPRIGPAGLLAPLLLLHACIQPAPQSFPPNTTVAGPSTHLDAHRPPPDRTATFQRAQNQVMLIGAVNAVVAFRIELAADRGPAAGVTLHAEDLIGPADRIPADAVRVYRLWPVTIDRYPNWYLRSQGLQRSRDILDVLVPLYAPIHGQPFHIPKGHRLPLWVEIRIPPDAVPGTYRGAVSLHDAAGHSARTPIEILVHDIYLDPASAPTVLARVQLAPLIAAHTDLDPMNPKLALADDDAKRLLTSAFKILHDHGLSPYTDEVHPRLTQDRNGAAQLDWADYDDFCTPLIDGSAYRDARPARAWPFPADLNQPHPPQFGGIHDPRYFAILKDTLARTRAHFIEHGWLDQAFVAFDLPKTPNPHADDLKTLRQLARLTHRCDPDLPFLSSLIPQPMAPFGWSEHWFEDLSNEVDIWATPARYQHRPTLKSIQASGNRTWLLPDRPPYSGSLAIEAPPIHARSLPWQAFLQGHAAVWLPHATDWPDRLLDTPISQTSQPSDTWLLYPGTPFGLEEPVPSVRLKQLQLGIQEAQCLQRLDERGRGETARLLAGSLIKATGTDAYGDNYLDPVFNRRIDDPETWELARSLLLDELAGALTDTHQPASGPELNRAAWAKFLSATRRIEVWTEAARLTRDQRPGHTGFRINYDVAMRNELRTRLVGHLELGPTAPGIERVSDRIRVGPVPEMGLAVKRMVLHAPNLPPTDLDGHHAQVLILDAGPAGTAETRAVLSIVQVPHSPNRITVDGNLEDWPPNQFNIAGDFRLINDVSEDAMDNRTARYTRTGRAKPASQTVAFFCQHNAHLYIGIHVAVPPHKRDPKHRPPMRNYVTYEDLMPVGEDLVEILIDPTNAGTQSDDLYHVVLKVTGNPIFERGIDTHPPIGRRRPWPGDPPKCCVVATKYGWCAELAIPIASFGPDAHETPVWGINLTRFEPHRGEYSDWARAPRHGYNPRSLGNLLWPP